MSVEMAEEDPGFFQPADVRPVGRQRLDRDPEMGPGSQRGKPADGAAIGVRR